jgi:hypothetical protein
VTYSFKYKINKNKYETVFGDSIEKLKYISQVIYRRTCAHQAMQAQPSLLVGNSDSDDDMGTSHLTGEGAGAGQPACSLMGGRLRKKKTRRYKRKRRNIKRRKTYNRKHKKS